MKDCKIEKKSYTTPFVRVVRILPSQVLAVSIINEKTADPSSDILVKKNTWWVFKDNDGYHDVWE